MKRLVMILAALCLLAAVGCRHNLRSNGCSSCGHGGSKGGHAGCHPGGCNHGLAGHGGPGGHGHGGLGGGLGGGHGLIAHGTGQPQIPRLPKGHYPDGHLGPAGPPTAAVAYPYYTIRGPRDFLVDDPPPLGY